MNLVPKETHLFSAIESVKSNQGPVVQNGGRMTVEMNMFPLHHHHHQQALQQLAQHQGLPPHQPPLHLHQHQHQEHRQMYQKEQNHPFGKLETVSKVSRLLFSIDLTWQ